METKFIEVFKEALEMEEEQVNMFDEFRSFETWDSLSRLSLIALLDEYFDVTIENDEFESLITVGDLYNCVKSKKKS